MFVFTMLDKLFTGRKPPDEINVIAKLNESKNLKSKIFKITKIPNVIDHINARLSRGVKP